jgi:hypothetical protein
MVSVLPATQNAQAEVDLRRRREAHPGYFAASR